MKRILITGAKGMLGQDLVKILENDAYDLLPVDIDGLDITKENNINDFFNQNKNFDIVIHCAAYTQVDLAEKEQEKAFLVNETGTKNIAKKSAELNIPIIYISTDYVFDGTKTTPYEPNDTVNPLNIYGLSKLKGEESLKNHTNKYYILRTSWLYGHKGKNFVETMIRLAKEKTELRVVDDQIGCPTWTVALAKVIKGFIETEKPYGIYNVCGSGQTSWYKFTCKIMELTQSKVKITPITSSEYPQLALRPKYSVMNNNNICPHWEESLKEYLKTRSN